MPIVDSILRELNSIIYFLIRSHCNTEFKYTIIEEYVHNHSGKGIKLICFQRLRFIFYHPYYDARIFQFKYRQITGNTIISRIPQTNYCVGQS